MPSRVRTLSCACAGAAALSILPCALTGAARADISDAKVIDGPSSAIVSLDAVAMAPDGTGGLVYTKRAAGRTHIFVSRFVNGAWQAPTQADAGQPFDSTFPAIGAGNGGRLVVVWVQAYGANVQDRLYSASLDPGARSFQAPIPIDLDVRDGTDVYPAISMNAGGTAYLVYRVVLARQDPTLPPNTVFAQIRAQRYSGALWSALGNPLNRNVNQPMPLPTALDAPQVATDTTGNAVVAWRELDDEFVPRVYARRLFGQTQGFIKQVSPSTFGGKPSRGGVDQFTLAGSPFGESAVVWRQRAASQDAFTRPRAFVSELPNTLANQAADFLAPQAIDLGGADGPAADLGPVSVSVSDDGKFDAGVGVGTTSVAVPGDETTLDKPLRLDDGTSTIGGTPQVTRSNEGALAAAWAVAGGGSAGIGVREIRSDGTPATQQLSAPAGGAVGALKLGGSGLGDAAIGFLQGTGDATQLVGASVNAPPESFDVATPSSWTKDRRIGLTWDDAPHAIGGVSYTLQVDGDDLKDKLSKTTYTTKPGDVDDGKHTVTVVATDAAGQETTSADAALLVDRTAPRATIKVARRTHRVTVRSSDGAKGSVSGLDGAHVKVTFGDGHHAAGKKLLTHRYRHGGTYTVTVSLADKAANKRTVRKRVHA